MTDWTITLADGSTTAVAADEVTTRQDGSLWLLAALNPRPAPLTPVLVLARGKWTAAYPSDTNPLPDVPTPPERTPRAV